VGVGKVCALTGEPWSDSLQDEPQSYVVVPGQPWLDGVQTRKGKVRQFVAMPLGLGYTVEAQLTGDEVFGGIQLEAFPARPGRIRERSRLCCEDMRCAAAPLSRSAGSMGLGAGGSIDQKVYPDPHGVDVWDLASPARCFVHIVNSELWREITGAAPPRSPVTARQYARRGLPWFSLYDEHAPALEAEDALSGIATIRQIDGDKSSAPLQDDAPVEPGPVKRLVHRFLGGAVRDGDW
jgi:hypothetical protein